MNMMVIFLKLQISFRRERNLMFTKRVESSMVGTVFSSANFLVTCIVR